MRKNYKRSDLEAVGPFVLEMFDHLVHNQKSGRAFHEILAQETLTEAQQVILADARDNISFLRRCIRPDKSKKKKKEKTRTKKTKNRSQ